MQTLAKLKSGEYLGVKELTLRENLSTFPLEILQLADTLEFLDLSHNLLTQLPKEIGQLKKLKRVFFSFNKLSCVPDVFKECSNLEMLGLKANQMIDFDEDILPLSIHWLILTDNKITKLPKSIGKLTRLRKFPLAGNKLCTLPTQMQNCVNLELIRLSANQFTSLPNWLFHLPKLSWLAFSGNPCSVPPKVSQIELDYDTLELHELLGEGASGRIYKAHAKTLNKDVACKIFKGEVTSDGYAKDEMSAYLSTGIHKNLIKVEAKIKGEDPQGLILELIPKSYKNLGDAPNFETCTRDTYAKDMQLSIQDIIKILQDILSAAQHLHSVSLMHGDLYAHNILVDYSKGHSYLGDFGAASFYDKNDTHIEKLEVRAFGCLCDDLLKLCHEIKAPAYKKLRELADRCMQENVSARPSFMKIALDF